jgi:hypothetical protein
MFPLLALTALIAATAMALVLSLNLRQGFADYLGARDRETLVAVAGTAQTHIAAQGG